MRVATLDDCALVEEIVLAAYEPWVDVIGMRPRPMDEDYAALIAEGRVHLTGADGLIVLVPEDGVLLVDNVAVRPELHGRGIGRGLMAFAETEARRLGLPALRLYTHVMMARNTALYESLGYVETDRGQVVHMRKELR